MAIRLAEREGVDRRERDSPVVQGVLPLVPLYLMKLIVDAATEGLAAPDKGAAVRQVVWLVALMGATALAGAFFRSIAGLVGTRRPWPSRTT